MAIGAEYVTPTTIVLLQEMQNAVMEIENSSANECHSMYSGIVKKKLNAYLKNILLLRVFHEKIESQLDYSVGDNAIIFTIYPKLNGKEDDENCKFTVLIVAKPRATVSKYSLDSRTVLAIKNQFIS